MPTQTDSLMALLMDEGHKPLVRGRLIETVELVKELHRRHLFLPARKLMGTWHGETNIQHLLYGGD